MIVPRWTRTKRPRWMWAAAMGPALLLVAQSGSPGTSLGSRSPSFTVFESGQVRPLALSPDGSTLFAVNTPDNRLEVFRITSRGLVHRGSVSVGLEPVAVAARTDREVWVVNHLSDTVSVVRLVGPGNDEDAGDDENGPRARGPAGVGRVVRTLLVGDEPRDIVFGGSHRDRAFITTAHRGQNVPYDPQLTTPGIGRADVWVFDADDPGHPLGGTPLTIIALFTDTPRALAVSPDGGTVYAAGFHTGNRTTTITEEVVTTNGGLPGPHTNFEGIAQPPTGLIVKHDGAHWTDELGRVRDAQVKFSLPDEDVFVIDALANPPKEIGAVSGVGTVIFNLAVNPATGDVYVANTDARNETRFAGPGRFAGSTVRGHLHESRITVLRGPEVLPRHLNKHIDYRACCAPVPNDENARSLGDTLYVAAFGSGKIGVFNTAELAADTFVPDSATHIPVSGGGPTGLVLDEPRGRLYVLTRFDNAIAAIDIATRTEIAHVPMFNPEPPSVVRGRRFLYDASFTSSHGDSACASCHVFGDFDSLAWDLGDPDARQLTNPGPFVVTPADVCGPGIRLGCLPDGTPTSVHFRPMKGPMATQSLRGLANHGSMHWRGDRTGGNDAPSAQPDSGTFDEDAAFKKFDVAFEDLLGRHAPLSPADMQALTDFVLQITYPPNPIRNLDNSLTADQRTGRDFFFGPISDTFTTCNDCHRLDPKGNAEHGVARPGFFGTDGRSTFDSQPQVFKIPHLRNLYQKVGMFGMPRVSEILPESFDPGVDNAFMGEQVRGFGFKHDGSADTIFRLNRAVAFVRRPPGFAGPHDPGNLGGIPLTPGGVALQRQIEQFMLAFDSNLAPIVGQQITLARDNATAGGPRVDLLMARAEAGECDLVAKTQGDRREHGYLYVGGGVFRPDRRRAPLVPDSTLRARARRPGGEVTTGMSPSRAATLPIPATRHGSADETESNGRRAGGVMAMNGKAFNESRLGREALHWECGRGQTMGCVWLTVRVAAVAGMLLVAGPVS
jgi:DNA-binding beta-propeller fold protein YncE